VSAASTGRSSNVAWGTAIETVSFNGVDFRMYAERAHDVGTFLEFAERWGDRPHIVQGERVLTFAQLGSAAATKARVLQDLGVGRGDRVLLMGFNSPDWVVNFWAVVSVGAVPVLANAWWSVEEVRDAIALMEPTLVLADGRAAGRLPDGTRTGPWECAPTHHESTAAESLADVHGDEADENDPAAVIFTSGTSGRPKAVVLAHRSLLAGLHMLLHITKRLPQQVTEADGSTALHTGPMFHIGGIQTLLRAVIVGDTLVMPTGKFGAAEALELIETWKVSRWSAVPTMVSRVLEHPDVHTRDVRTLRSLTVGGAPVTGDFLAVLRVGFPGVEPRVATGYGLTENGGQATAASGKDTAARPGNSGKALPCVELKIAETDQPGDGEILVRSPTQMLGYHGVDESPVDADGWLHTGDLGRVDEDGYLWITGRSKEMIIRGGENIAPQSVEEALNSLPSVVECAVFSVPDRDLGEDVMAFVSVRTEETAESLRSQLAGRLASFAIPGHWQIVHDTLPVNHSGKIDKPAIAAAARAALETTSAPVASEGAR